MQRKGRGWIVAVLLVLPLVGAACGGKATEEGGQPPAVAITHGKITQVKVTPEAAKLLGIRTVSVRSDAAGTHRTVIPYDAVLYDPDGKTWTYTNPEPLVFQRTDIRVAQIHGNAAVLVKGPPVGTRVVTAGATEIWGVEYGGIEED